MPVWYTPASAEDYEILWSVIDDYYPDLIEVYGKSEEARIGLVLAHPDPESDKPAMQTKGVRILAKIKPNSEADRVDGKPDATITLDAEHWKSMAEDEVDGYAQAQALIDHELYHLIVRREKKSRRILTDEAGRPKFSTRPHDWEITGFRVVAERHKQHAAEVIVAKQFYDDYGQLLFHFAEHAVQRELKLNGDKRGVGKVTLETPIQKVTIGPHNAQAIADAADRAMNRRRPAPEPELATTGG